MKTRRTVFVILLMAASLFGVFFLTACGRKNQSWTVTQYPMLGGGQGMAYTITDAEGKLAIIDGGIDDADANRLEQIIAAHGNHVDSWIITHTHPDHVNAFNIVMQDPNFSFTFDHLYTVPYNSKRYEETARDYDGFASHETFVALAEGLPQFAQLKENDELTLLGLRMKVLSAWDENVDAFDHNLCNYGSMMFRLDGKDSSMLFCADVEKEMEPFILSSHRDELKADFVQCAHHANWGLREEFYDLVGAKVAFFDGPDELYEESDRFDGYLLRAYFEQKGAQVYRQSDGPHSIVIS